MTNIIRQNQTPPPVLEDSLALYVHWPWCKKKCPYCDFNSHTSNLIPEAEYLKALLTHLELVRSKVGKRRLTSIFFGGGTPSLMAADTVKSVVETADNLFSFADNIEITLEANPTSSEAQKFRDFANAGVNRLSVGMQSLQQNDLSFLGREHNVAEAMQAVTDGLHAVGNVNLDLIFGLPKQDLELWEKDLTQILNLGTQHISCYQLTIEKNTAFYADWRKGKLKPASDDTQAHFYEQTTAILDGYGYKQYEVSNYAQGNKVCRHNQHIWRYGEYIGVGAGAHGRRLDEHGVLNATRNYRMPDTYMEEVYKASQAQYETTPLNKTEKAVEATLLGLRLAEGLPLARIEALTANPWQDTIDPKGIKLMIDNGFIKQSISDDGLPIIAATPVGMRLLNSVIEHLLK